MESNENAYVGTDPNGPTWQSEPINTPAEVAKLESDGVLEPVESDEDEELDGDVEDESEDEEPVEPVVETPVAPVIEESKLDGDGDGLIDNQIL